MKPCLLTMLFVHVLLVINTLSDKIDRKHVKCLVCHRVVEELLRELEAAGPPLAYENSGYMINSMDNPRKSTDKRISELFLVELMERLCKKMGEYVRALNKLTGQLEVVPILIDGKMNPAFTSYDLIKDGDLESLEFYCESILSEYDEDVVRLSRSTSSLKVYTEELCFHTKICKKNVENLVLSKDEL